jgi:hypothetical protein
MFILLGVNLDPSVSAILKSTTLSHSWKTLSKVFEVALSQNPLVHLELISFKKYSSKVLIL